MFTFLTQAETGMTGVIVSIGGALLVFAVAFAAGFLFGRSSRRKPLARKHWRFQPTPESRARRL